MLKDFCAKLFITDNDKYSADDININGNEDNNEQNNLNKTDPNDKIILEGIEPFINEIDNIEPPNYFENNEFTSSNKIKSNNKNKNKKRKIKKMKNYNIRKGDWQCKYCFNINFHFRTICNICNKNKS